MLVKLNSEHTLILLDDGSIKIMRVQGKGVDRREQTVALDVRATRLLVNTLNKKFEGLQAEARLKHDMECLGLTAANGETRP